jgi:hypothetical protein
MRVENHRTSATTMRIRPAQRPPRRRVRDTPPAAGAAIVAKFDREMLGIYTDNSAAQPGALTLLGTPIDLGRVTCDSCVIAARTDHIPPWMPCYMTSQLLGGETEVIVHVHRAHPDHREPAEQAAGLLLRGRRGRARRPGVAAGGDGGGRVVVAAIRRLARDALR